MTTDTFNNHINRLREQTNALRETLSVFRANYTALQFGMHRLDNELKRSREEFDQLTGRQTGSAAVVQMNTNQDNDIQLTA